MAEITLFQALSLASGAISALGSLSQGRTQAKIAERNALVADQQAEATRRQRDFELDRLEDKKKRVLATQVNNAADPAEGSGLLLQLDTAEEAALDALAIRFSSSVSQAQSASQAGIDRLSASEARVRGLTGAGASLLSGARTLGRKAITVPNEFE